jgi:hypothetical protein
MTAQVIWTLSTLPSAASALQSSISALERDITVRESQSSGLEPWLGRFTLLVAIGVALEILVVIHDHRKEVNEWRVSELIPEGPSLIKLGIQIASIILVIAGVLGEFGVGLTISSINGQLRAKSAELRSKSDQLLALVTQEAGAAQTSAQGAATAASLAKDASAVALDQSGKAKTSASDALALARNTRQEAEAFKKDLEEAKVFAQQTFMRTRPRMIDNQKFQEALKGKPKDDVEILFTPGDEEAYSLAAQIRARLTDPRLGMGADWTVSVFRPLIESDALSGELNRSEVPLATKAGAWWGLGLVVRWAPYPPFGHENDSPVIALQSALMASGVRAPTISVVPTMPDNVIKIIIGQEQSGH